MSHECDYKQFCEDIIRCAEDLKSGILTFDEFEETLWELVVWIKPIINVDAESGEQSE